MNYREINLRTGQQKYYVVLSAEERAKGFVRPVRRTYRHVGPAGPENLRELTMDEQAQYAGRGYVKFEAYPESESPKTGRFWTQAQLDRVGSSHTPGGGCGSETTMSRAIAETYARDPGFYGGGTFCVFCNRHFPVDEFVWQGTNERVGT